MPQPPSRKYRLERTEDYRAQLQRMIDNGEHQVLQRSLPGVLFAIETRADHFAVVPECGYRAVGSDGAGVEPSFTVWFSLDIESSVATLHGLTFFQITGSGGWDDD